jgi:hypothetical protein
LHPSMSSEFDDDEDGMEKYLPDGVTEEQADALVKEVLDEIEKIGLYVKHAHMGATEPDAFGQPTLVIFGLFTMGKVVFTDRVLNPEQDKFDDSFNQIESDETKLAVIDIVESFRRGKDDS